MTNRTSAGILLYRQQLGHLEVLLAHPGGPFHRTRDQGDWSIPKGEPAVAEDLADAAVREFEEETGTRLPDGPRISLGSVQQKGGKIVTAWAVEGDLDPAASRSNEFVMEWPPGSGQQVAFPEIDRVEWFAMDEAHRRIKEAQAPFLARLEHALDAGRAE
ncbi:MAG: NUDIX domain-containing protein [Candidatus Limnocylindrales bacterium]